MHPVDLILIIGATVRLTHLAQVDSILDRPRGWLHRRLGNSKPAELLFCPWCLSIWIGAAVAASWAQWGGHLLWHATAAALTASHVTGLLALWEER